MDHLNITLEILAAAGGAEGKTISEQFGIDSYKLIAQVLTFVTVWFILKWKAFGPILEMLEKRKQRIAEGEENLKRMQEAVTGALSTLAHEVTKSVGFTAEDISEVVLVANTCMHHIFLGIDPESLGKSPFNPRIQIGVNVKARDLQVDILPSVNIHLLPIFCGDESLFDALIQFLSPP